MNSQKTIEGVAKKSLTRLTDERGFFEELIRVTDDFFSEGFGQLSHSYMHGGVIKAWHIHKKQVDWWYVARGTLKVVLYDLRKKSATYQKLDEFLMGECGEDIVLKIPAGVAHGCRVLSSESELFYITSKTYDAGEEGRLPHDDPKIGYNWFAGPPIK